MNDSSCASSSDIERLSSWHLLICQFIQFIAILITFISSFFAIDLVWKKSIFEKSTKFLIFLNLFYANLHQISYGIEAYGTLYKHFFILNEPCKILQQDAHCAPYFQILIAEISGMFLCQTALVIERAFATFLENYQKKRSLIISLSISIIVIIISSSTGPMIVLDDPLTGYSISCVSFPKHSSNRASPFFITCLVIALFNLILTISIMSYNKKFEYETRFKVGARFQKREVIVSTETICFLALSQFILMLIYCGGILIIICIKRVLPQVTFSSWVVWVYTVPFIAMMFPLLLIYRIRSSRSHRIQIIKSFAERKYTQDDHMKQMKQTWGE